LKAVVILLATVSLGTGLVAAYYWNKASRVHVMPFWEANGSLEPMDPTRSNTEWIVAQMETTRRSGRLNAIAARWTAVSVLLGGIASIAGATF